MASKDDALQLIRRALLSLGLVRTLAVLDAEAADAMDTDLDVLEQLRSLDINQSSDDADLVQDSCTKITHSEPRILQNVHASNILCVASATLSSACFPAHSTSDPVSVVFSGAADRTLRISDAFSGKVLAILGHHNSPVLSISLYPPAPYLVVTTGMDGCMHLVNINNAHLHVSDASVNPSNPLSSSNPNSQPKLNQDIHFVYQDHAKYVTRSAFSPNGEWLVSGSHDRTINIYRNTSSNLLAPVFEKRHSVPFKGTVESLCFLPQSQDTSSTTAFTLVVGVRDDNYLHYIQLDSSESFPISKHNMNANKDDWVSFAPIHIAPSPSGRHLAVYTDSKAGRIIIFNTNTMRIARDLWGIDADEFTQASCCWHPSGSFLFATSNDKSILAFHVSSGHVAARLTGHQGVIRNIAYDAVNCAVVSCSYDKTIRVWPVQVQ